jgi:DNA polymerase-1
MKNKQSLSFHRNQISLFQTIPIEELPDIRWELPELSQEKRIGLDTEGTGLRLWNGDVPIGISVSTEDFQYAWYIPFAHKVGFNFDLENVKLWFKDNIKDKDVDLLHAKFDHNMMKHVGLDLEEGNNSLHDVMHPPALLYPKRQDLDLNSLVSSELGKKKIELQGDFTSFPMQERNSAAVWWYATVDAQLTSELAAHYAPKIAEEGLERVLELEDALIPCVASMERQGALLDTERLSAWRQMARNRYIKLVLEIYKQTGIRVEPTKSVTLARLFTALKIQFPYTDSNKPKPSFTNEFLKKHLHIEPIRLAYEARQLASLESKALTKFENSVGKDGRIRYSLNQLKAVNDEGSKGAVTGRFSSSSGGKAINGVNIQQVIDDEKQGKIDSIKDFPIRDLFLPEPGMQWLSADAMQIEFRLFAHYSQSDRLLRAYRENPLVDFHDYVAEKIMYKQYTHDEIKAKGLRKIIKNINFGKLYGLGIYKLANFYLHCSLEEAKSASDHYNREFPEARELMNAVISRAESRGWVKTILGRKHKFGPGIEERYYAALNYVIQGSAADIMKKKLLELYNNRKQTGFIASMTIHDEVAGSVPNFESAIKVKNILNVNDFPQIQIPILWKASIGKTWMQAEEICMHDVLKSQCEVCK